MADNFEKLLKTALEKEVSDIHITSNKKICFRKNKKLFTIDEFVSDKEVSGIITNLLDEKTRPVYNKNGSVDLAFKDNNNVRYRINIYNQISGPALSIRVINDKIMDLAKTASVDIIKEISALNQGLVLITGPAGSGKSTTLASIIEYINQTQSRHIITIEDPVEYVYQDKKSLIHQIEIGPDALNFNTALISSLRQDPDIIMIGEIRDGNAMETAIRAAETGHLVLSSLHTDGAAKAIGRISDFFELSEQSKITQRLSEILKIVISQKLLISTDGGLVLCQEILKVNKAAQNIIRTGRTEQLDSIMQTSSKSGMITMDNSLIKLYNNNQITTEELRKNCSNLEYCLSLLSKGGN